MTKIFTPPDIGYTQSRGIIPDAADVDVPYLRVIHQPMLHKSSSKFYDLVATQPRGLQVKHGSMTSACLLKHWGKTTSKGSGLTAPYPINSSEIFHKMLEMIDKKKARGYDPLGASTFDFFTAESFRKMFHSKADVVRDNDLFWHENLRFLTQVESWHDTRSVALPEEEPVKKPEVIIRDAGWGVWG